MYMYNVMIVCVVDSRHENHASKNACVCVCVRMCAQLPCACMCVYVCVCVSLCHCVCDSDLSITTASNLLDVHCITRTGVPELSTARMVWFPRFDLSFHKDLNP